ncbi:uncharacterized protein BX663DRAFT_296074 [Cokeromyces recurvatus]|uniref:uncharacterized protein n=1 Tax=Cokeromyces recurvatus TaxID=90255 RepID=UPI00221E780F|nr:uncharacterized protein BX663DRAFT_296074 [Cokeromyces recurvatus]KAI7897795.1 hypothetical protein BX663DRAFT_296074 [Cokeromyces recurvatus]
MSNKRKQSLNDEQMKKDDNDEPVTTEKENKLLLNDELVLTENKKSSFWKAYPTPSSVNMIDPKNPVKVEEDEKKERRSNVVLPSFHSQFQPVYPPSSSFSVLFSKIIETVRCRSLFSKGKEERTRDDLHNFIETIKKESINKSIKRKRFLIVGVHGWFPMKCSLFVV